MKGDPEVPEETADPEGDAALTSVSDVAGRLSKGAGPEPRHDAATGSHPKTASLHYAVQTPLEESGHQVGLWDTKTDGSELGGWPSP